jgi:flagellar hook-associated protein 2
MAGGASVSGLVSGLDTATIISQLMQVEAGPQTLLKTKLSTEQGTVSNLQAINAKFAALQTKAAALATTASWNPLTATSSSDRVTVNAGSTATPGALSFTVDATATATRGSAAQLASANQVVTDTGSDGSHQVVLTVNGTQTTLDAGDGTINSVVSAINGANKGVTAVAVQTDQGYRLRVTSTTTGSDQSFSVTTTSNAPVLGLTTTAGTDAQITVEGDVLTSHTNTFTGVTQGVDVTVAPGTPAGTDVDISIARNASGAQTALQGLVDGANELLTTIDSMTAYNATTKTSGPLAGDPTVRDQRSKLLDTVTRAADGSSMSTLGIGVDRYGKITFDSATFSSAYAADPGAVSAKLGAGDKSAVPGWASRLASVSKLASDSTTGILTSSITGHQGTVTTLQDSIADWDTRLAAKQQALQTQFTALEVSLGKLQDQASWLSGQISSLPSKSS